MSEESKELNIVKRVCADVFIILDTDVIKAMSNDIPINLTCKPAQIKIIEQAIKTEGDITFRLVKKSDVEI